MIDLLGLRLEMSRQNSFLPGILTKGGWPAREGSFHKKIFPGGIGCSGGSRRSQRAGQGPVDSRRISLVGTTI